MTLAAVQVYMALLEDPAREVLLVFTLIISKEANLHKLFLSKRQRSLPCLPPLLPLLLVKSLPIKHSLSPIACFLLFFGNCRE